MASKLEIPESVEYVEKDGAYYYNLKQLMAFFELTYFGFSRMKHYNLKLIWHKSNKRHKGPVPCFVLESDIKNIIYRHRKLADKYLIKK